MEDHSQHTHPPNKATDYQKNSITLIGAISLGTGVMIGAGILALTGQIAELAGSLFPLAFLATVIGIVLVFIGERFFLRHAKTEDMDKMKEDMKMD